MTCPRCEIGNIEQIQFIKDAKKALLCTYCDTVWFDGEDVSLHSGHALKGCIQNDQEYIFYEVDEKDKDIISLNSPQ